MVTILHEALHPLLGMIHLVTGLLHFSGIADLLPPFCLKGLSESLII